jgi:hypothetical protein
MWLFARHHGKGRLTTLSIFFHSVDQWVWEDVIEGWSYDRASAPTYNLGPRRFGGHLLSPKITEVKDTTTEVDWLPVQFEPTAIIGRKRRTPGEGPTIKNDNDKSLWKTTWRQVVRPGDELPAWQREATRRDVQRLHRLPNGSLLVVFQWTWQFWVDSLPSMIEDFEEAQAARPHRRTRAKRPKPDRPPPKVTCRWCPVRLPRSEVGTHTSSQHPDVNNVESIKQQVEDMPEEEIWDDHVSLGFLRRMSWHKQNELDCGFSMVMPRKVFARKFVMDGVAIEQSTVLGEDVITVTVEGPNVLNDLLGANWWWKELVDVNGNFLRSFVMFGKRTVFTPGLDADGKRIGRTIVDKVVLRHTVKAFNYHGRQRKESKMDVWFRRTRGPLLPALPAPVAASQ